MDTGKCGFRVWLAGILALASLLGAAPRAVAAPGDLDPSFDGDGKVTTDSGSGEERWNAVALDNAGRIVAVGSRAGLFAAARYNRDGSLDTSFDGDGLVTTDFGVSGEANDVTLDSLGRIVVAGEVRFDRERNPSDFGVVRYNSDGSLDTTFDGDGKVTTDFFEHGDGATALILQGDGRILVAGSSGSDFAVARYNSNGSLDPTFDTDGRVTTSFPEGNALGIAAALDGSGRIVVAGGGGGDFALARYNPNGSLDTTFGGDGKVTTDLAGSEDRVNDIALDRSGRIVAAGMTGIYPFRDFAVARYNTDGSLETAFGGGDGWLTTDFAGNEDRAWSVSLDKVGRIVLTGQSRSATGIDFALARYQPTGALDTTFGSQGMVTTDFAGGTDRAYGMVLDTADRIVLVGQTGEYPTQDFAAARYLADGLAPPALWLPAVLR